ncbi:MAG TPA: hypothetical protein ENH20_00400 [Candidatus Pacearchaeota archaeon]|nr:hypothetical protein [Candidatus Pacearchaeota archaeon]
MTILLIGGYPKGHDIPFHPNTRSGKILRKIIKENNLNPKIINLWENDKQEKTAIISTKIIDSINLLKPNHHIVALGRWQKKALIKHKIKCTYLPHPASWQPLDRPKLIKGLIKLNNNKIT